MTRRAVFSQAAPDGYFLDESDREGLTQYLHAQAWIDSSDVVRALASAGEGNMNCTLRVTTRERTFILKQSRPWVEKYPEIAAPLDRAIHEGAFYEAVAGHPPVAGMMPRLLGVNRASRILMLADLGAASDYTGLYQGDVIDGDAIDALVRYLSELHAVRAGSERQHEFLNRDMRRLNHHHLFEYPLQRGGSGVDLDRLTPGLRSEADRLGQDDDYVAAVTRLGGLYLDDGRSLLHGDFSQAAGSEPHRAFALSIRSSVSLARPSSTLASSSRISLWRGSRPGYGGECVRRTGPMSGLTATSPPGSQVSRSCAGCSAWHSSR